MDSLHERLAELADDAPKGGAPAAELWARGKRAYRLRVAAALAATLLVVGAVGTGIGVGLGDGDGDGDGNRSEVASAGPVDITLPIEYPAGEELPNLGDTPGRLAAIWWAPSVDGGAPQTVGLVAETGAFGMLPIDHLYPDEDDEDTSDPEVALSPDGRKIAYLAPKRELVVRDLVSGENYSTPSDFETRGGFKWIDDTHLHGHVAGGSDGDGWLWEPGTAPTLVNPYLVPYGGTDLSVPIQGGGSRSCWPPTVQNIETMQQRSGGVSWEGSFKVPVLCDVLGVIGSGTLLGHWNSGRLPGDWNDPNDGNGTVVALDISGAEPPFEEPALRRVVATAGAPVSVTFATDLIGEALDADGGAS